jgi:hypothetical protein
MMGTLADALKSAGHTKKQPNQYDIFSVADNAINFPEERLGQGRTRHESRLVIILQNNKDNYDPTIKICTIAPLSTNKNFYRLDYLLKSELFGGSKDKGIKGTKEKELSNKEKRVLSLNKGIDWLNKYTYLNALSFPNIVSPIVNLGIALYHNVINASTGRDINFSSLANSIIPFTKSFTSPGLTNQAVFLCSKTSPI